MRSLGGGAKPCDYFDMMSGSGTGGLIALMLGRLQMSVDDCLRELTFIFGKLYEKPLQEQMKRLSKGKPRFDMPLSNETLEDMVKRVAPDAKQMNDTSHQSCRTFVVAENNDTPHILERIRSYNHRGNVWIWRTASAMSSTMTTPTAFNSTFVAALSMHKYSNTSPERTNPSVELLEEARDVFGPHRRVGCLISCGSGLLSKSFAPDSSLPNGIPEHLTRTVRDAVIGSEEVDLRMQKLCEGGSYFRFDPADAISAAMNENDWRDIVFWEQLKNLDSIGNITTTYMQNEDLGVPKWVEECAFRLAVQKNNM
ncbi:FabD/lysophospholipase-like protein [Sistotremastrum suecicum HHB10207 ss-3]|uniref:FabD/lysophospholipase-like protein n=1 Tax=Sistotremastrum suecicum HHB10207 ss-3 TaxID=1314776 RepID=A0A165YJI0_9AGAM|nr:FabD/lysophospholipase-like protein [Sistotremastrum suecicum HHB10207 ss-3]